MRKMENGVSVRLKKGELQILAINERIFRVIYSTGNTAAQGEREELVVVGNLPRFTAWKAEENNENVRLITNKTVAVFSKENEIITFYDAKSGLRILSEHSRSVGLADTQGKNAFGIEQEFISPDDEIIYGLGQQVDGAINYRGRFVHLNQYNTISVVPVILSSKGYGIIWNNCSLTEINRHKEQIPLDFNPCTKTQKALFKAEETGEYVFITEKLNKNLALEKIEVKINGKTVIFNETQWHPNYYTGTIHLEKDGIYSIFVDGTVRLYVQPPSCKRFTSIYSEIGSRIDYYFMYGPEPDNIVSCYRQLTGSPPLFGKWAYGYWQCKERYKTGEELVEIIKEYRKRKHPIDNIIQDWMYWGDYGWNALKFHPDYCSDMERVIDELHNLNAHVMVSVWPNFGESDKNEAYLEFKKKGYLMDDAALEDLGDYTAALQGNKKNFYDAFNEKAREEFWKMMKQGLFDKGVDAWWLDADEPNLWSIQGAYRMYNTCKGPAAKFVNAYPLVHAKGIYENQRALTKNKRVFILSRSGFTGIQRYAAAVWSGDTCYSWDVFRKQIVAGIQYCLSGLPYWTTDIGGFVGGNNDDPDYREIYIRWFQFAAFCPIFRAHGTKTPREIWQFGEQAENIMHDYLVLRYRLMPYIYSVAWKTTRYGYTIMRGLVMDFFHDRKALTIGDQFMFGPAFMVCPVTEGGVAARMVYLPECAGWYDFWTGIYYEGGQNITASSPLEKIPLYVRAGSIVLMGPELQHADEKTSEPLEIRVYCGEDAEFALYEDEGDGYGYERGIYSEIRILWDQRRKKLTIGKREGRYPGMPGERDFRIVFIDKQHTADTDCGTRYKTCRYNGDEIYICMTADM